MFSYPSYIFIVFPCTSFLKISYCANVLSGACTHHGLLLSIHFHKAIANSASVILIGLILFFFIFVSFARSFSRQASSQLWRFSETSHEGRCCYHMLSGLVRERERLWGADGLGIKRGGKKGKRKNTCTAGRVERREYSGKTPADGGGTHWETPNPSQNGA